MIPSFQFRRIAILPTGIPTSDDSASLLSEWFLIAATRGADAFYLRIPKEWTEIPLAWERSCQQFASQLILPMRLWPRFGDAMAYHSTSHEALAPISGMVCGRSCHTHSELRDAQAAGFSYAFFSPVFSTKTHPEAEPLGLASLQAACKALQLPIFALGGVTWENAPHCIAHGAHGVAGISMFSH